MRILLAALLLVGLAAPASAQVGSKLDWRPYAVLFAGQYTDLVTTLHVSPEHPCVETNALLGPHPSMARVLLPKVALVASLSVLVRFSERRESKAARVIAKSAAYLGGVVGLKDGWQNAQRCW